MGRRFYTCTIARHRDIDASRRNHRKLITLHTETDVDRLEELLNNPEVMPDAMCVSELDGYVAGLLVCPDLIMPSEWLPEVWAVDEEPAFDSTEQAEETIAAVMAHYNRVAENLASGDKPYEIVLERPSQDEPPLWEFWISGFYQAMRLRPDAWEAYWAADDDTVVGALSVMAALIDIEAGESPVPEDNQATLAAEAPDTIPSIIVTLNRWLKSQSAEGMGATGLDWWDSANSNSRPARSTKVGRNEPCPCGSGRKHKRCCGAN